MVYPGQLKLELRQRQLQDIYGNNVIYTGASPLTLNQAPGTLVNPWVDYTLFVQGLDKLTLMFSTTQTPQGEVKEGQFLPKKGTSVSLTFERDAQKFIRSILVDDVAAPLNQIEARVSDISGVYFSGYVIKSTDLSWCEFNALCTYDLNIKQQDEWTQCIERTMIADNWQGMFTNQPSLEVAPGILKKHPRFSYCTEHRPNAILIVEWYMLSILGLFAIIVVAITAVLDIIKAIVNAVISFIDFLGGSISYLPITDPTAVFSSIAQLYIEAAGCGREHPAPLIRDYISNVCDKCQIKYDASTVDIFFAPFLTVQKSDRITYTEPNPHYNACLLFPNVRKGIRRFASINLFGASAQDTTTYYDELSQPVWALSDMLDHLKKLYNAQWRVITDNAGVPYLHFHRKDWYRNQSPLYDFSIGGADRPKLLEGICYQPTEFVAPASMNGLYQDDPSDRCGHEASRQMNGDPLSFNNTINNPLFHGILDKSSGFGATKFRLDGASTDWIYDALQVLGNGVLLNPALAFQMNTIAAAIAKYGDYALTLQAETVSLPKVVIWDGKDNGDGNRFLNARAIRDSIFIGASETAPGTEYFLGKTAYPGTLGTITTPDANTVYPQQVNPNPFWSPPSLAAPNTIPEVLTWEQVVVSGGVAIAESYPPNCSVIGHSLSFAPPVAGVYTVQDYFGSPILRNVAILVNYPMYFNPYFKDNMWDWFHWIDDPYRMPLLHKNWSLKIPLCKEDIQKLKADGDGFNIALLQPVVLDTNFYNVGVLTDINLSWETGSESGTPGTGESIELKGIV